MSRTIAAALAFLALGPAYGADLAVGPPLDQVPPLARIVPVAPPIVVGENIWPLIDLEGFWIRVRQCQTAAEVGAQTNVRYRGFPMTFQGIDTRTGEFRRVSILRAYRRGEDEGIDLPAVTFDIVSDGVPRSVTIPLWSGVRVLP